MADSNEILKVRRLNVPILKYFPFILALHFQNRRLDLLSKILRSYL